MSASMTASTWWTLLSHWVMVVSNDDAIPVRFLFTILVICVHALVLLDVSVSALCIPDLVLCAGAVVLIIGLCIFFRILRLASVDCYTLVTTVVDTVDNFWLGCVIDLL